MLEAELIPFIYYNIMLLFSLFTVISLLGKKGLKVKNSYVYLSVFIVLLLGLRPIDIIFVDTVTYDSYYNNYLRQGSFTLADSKDWLFDYTMYLFTRLSKDSIYFFLFIEALYVLCFTICIRHKFKGEEWLAILFCLGSLSFYNYGVNGIRNGLAASLFILALAYIQTKNRRALFLLTLAFFTHKAILLPIMGLIVSFKIKKTKYYVYLWLGCILLSLLGGNIWENLFASVGIDDRLSYLTDDVDSSMFSHTGFRWDFLVYSSLPIIIGTHYTLNKKFNDQWYKLILHIYIFSNSFWVLVIRANYSNRFAYLSWFLYPLVLIYPLLYYEKINYRKIKISLILAFHYLLTYILYIK